MGTLKKKTSLNRLVALTIAATVVTLALTPIRGNSAPLPSCFSRLFQRVFLKAKPSPPPKPPYISQNNPLMHSFAALNTDVFQVADAQAGAHGGTRVVVKRLGLWWDARKDFSSKGADSTFSLKSFPAAAGEEAASYFGFKQLDEWHFTLPDQKELSGAIADFNRGLDPKDPRRIEFDFYSTDQPFGTYETFIRRFVEEGKMPFASEGRQFYHDVSGHGLQGLVINNEILQLTQKRARIWLDFMEHVKNLDLSVEERTLLKEANTRFNKQVSAEIDQLGMGIGDLIPWTENSNLKRESAQHLEQSQLPHELKKSVTHQFILKSYSGVTAGMEAEQHPMLLNPPAKYFGENILQSAVPDLPLNLRFTNFLEQQQKIHPDRFKALSFNLEKELEAASEYKTIHNRRAFERKMRKLKLYRPFFERLDRLRELSANSREIR